MMVSYTGQRAVLGQELSSLAPVIVLLASLIYAESFALFNQFYALSNTSIKHSDAPKVRIRHLGTP